MADPIVVPLERDPTEIEQEIYGYIQSFYPEWDPKEPHVLVVLSEVLAAEISELRRLATDVGPEILVYVGRLLNIVAEEASPASGTVNITAIDSVGYTIPAGTEMRVLIHSDEYMGFATVAAATVNVGQTQVLDVPIVATSNGADGNNLTSDPELLDILDYVDSIELVGSTGGGVNAELIDDYLERLTTRLTLLADRPIVPRDFEIYVETLVPGVERALCLDTYDPFTATFGNERMVTMYALDETGVAVGVGVKTAMKDALEAARELTFVINVSDPTSNAITIDAVVVALPGVDLAVLEDDVMTALDTHLDPAFHGAPSIASGNSPKWLNTTKIRYSDIMWVIRNVEGVSYIDGAVYINGQPNTDLTLTGAAPIPTQDPTLNITVNALP